MRNRRSPSGSGRTCRGQVAITATKTAGVALAGLLAAVALVPIGAGAQTVERLDGANRYETAATISRQTFGAPTATAFLATGEAFPDALAAAPAAGPDGPVLLTTRDTLEPPAGAELDRLGPSQVFVIGGPLVISDAVLDAVETRTGATVERVFGDDRYGTAAEVAERFFEPALPLVYVASGERFPDAVAAGAAGARVGAPVLLVQQNTVPSSTSSALASLDPQRVVVVGGEHVISETVRQQLGAERIAGGDRYATAAALANSTSAGDEPVAFLASGEAFADAVAGGPAAARRDAPLLLVRPACMPQPTADALAAWGTGTRVVLGGQAAVSDAAAGGASCTATPSLTVDTVASGLSIPWDLAFTPDGAMLITERAGTVRALVNGQLLTVGRVPNVSANGEGGLLGMVLAPDFATSRHVYLCHNTSADVRVARYSVAGDYGSLTHAGDVVTGMPTSGGRHSGCRPRFGPDGFLWIGTGDAAQGTNPQDDNSLGGKVLRIVASTGAPAPGNATGTRVFTKGHRNVQGLAFRPGSATPYSAEHGPDRDDEINRLVNGGNYGWNPVPGYNEAVPMTDLQEFPNAVPAVWSSGSPTVATSGLEFLTGSQWRGWEGALAVACLRGERLLVMHLSEDGGSVAATQTILTNFGRLRTPVQGPDGNLYVTTSNGGGADVILRVRPS